MKGMFARHVLVVILFFALAMTSCLADVWYVKQGSSGNGQSWGTAFGSVDSALSAAQNGDEIWVAAGTYSTANQFTVPDGVGLFGGFDGTETLRDQRDWVSNTTTLSNAYMYANNDGSNNQIVIDGFSAYNITMYLHGNITLSHCIITGYRSNSSSAVQIRLGNFVKFVNNLVYDNSCTNPDSSSALI